MFNGLHYNSISTYMKEQFGCKVVKLSLDAGLTCPNRDGSKGTGGCTFCSSDGSGTFAGSIKEQIENVPKKWTKNEEKVCYLAYFQSHTNTYEKPEKLRKIWDEALSYPGVAGLAIATRPDCLGPEILSLLDEYNRKTFLWVELGLQTADEQSAVIINRCCKNADFKKAATDLSRLGIKHVTHLILGLPGESKETMIESAKYAAGFSPFGIKLHMLHVVSDSAMGREYIKAPFELLSMEEYISIVCDILEELPQSITIHRLTGDAPKETLLAPLWTCDKHKVLNAIQQEFKRRGTYQGFKLNSLTAESNLL